MAKVAYRRYPYTVTRVKVMKSSLLREIDYMRLYDMGYSEIARNLEEGEYKDDINTFAGKYHGIELIELSLNRNLVRTIEKLLMISNKKEIKELIETYSLKWVLNNFKLILKVKMGIISAEEMFSIHIPLQPTDEHYCSQMMKEDISAIIKDLFLLTDIDRKRLTELFEKKSIIEMENEIDKAYYRKLLSLKKRMKLSEKNPLKEFFGLLVTLTNIKTILRMKAKSIDNEKIASLLVLEDDLADSSLEHKLLESKDIHLALHALRKTAFSPLADKQVADDISLLENLCEKFLYTYAFRLLHRQPLSASAIFGFLLLKEIEVRNLRLFIHSKALGLDKEFIDTSIVM